MAILRLSSASAPNLNHHELGLRLSDANSNEDVVDVPDEVKPFHHLRSLPSFASSRQIWPPWRFAEDQMESASTVSNGPTLTSLLISYTSGVPGDPEDFFRDFPFSQWSKDVINTLFRRHPKITTLVIQANRNFIAEPFTPDVLPKLQTFATNLPLHTTLSIGLATQLIHVYSVFDDESMPRVQAMTHLRECVAHLDTKDYDFPTDLTSGIQKLILFINPKFRQSSISQNDIWTECFARRSNALSNLTHLGGISLINNDRGVPFSMFSELMKIPFLKYIGGNEVPYEHWGCQMLSETDTFFWNGWSLENVLEWTPVEKFVTD
ncbi:hypothetical protein M422DRAFT_255589 [Sphaerobolus stellatus SS14]|uniref:Uncharacterized protein n=1 Tax=Sphaerobolus stellatus (strain SS14) TaxID=990650 RepID=A0A0C9VIQ8_SPHS4|nr:hypothetical protein M422DRAFT_255589 [Sphaerobolus stellatus SS14]